MALNGNNLFASPDSDELEVSIFGPGFGEHRVILGGDLQVRKDRNLGWLAILDAHLEDPDRYQVFKVPHHGSANADFPDIWNRMMIPEPWAVTTPFVKGSVRLPKINDAKRILKYTKRAYLTSPPKPRRFKDPNRSVERTIREATRSAHIWPSQFGHVRLRKKLSLASTDPWQVELFGDALEMARFVELKVPKGT